MRNKLLLLVFTFLFFTFFRISISYSDIIYLKNGRRMEGLIKSESEKEIIVDLGYGTVTLSKEDVERIEKGTKEEIIRKEVSAEISNLAESLNTTKAKKVDAVKYKSRHDRLIRKIANIEQELPRLNARFKDLNDKLLEMKKDNVFAYNKQVAEINAASAQLRETIDNLNNTTKMKQELESDVSKSIIEYNQALFSLATEFDKTYQAENKSETLSEDNRFFYLNMKEEIDKLKRDFRYREVGFVRKDRGVIVETSLNNSVKASLLVDTGASLVVISRDIADRLGIHKSTSSGEIEVILADGSKTTAVPCLLDSVKVGDLEVNNVRAAIMEDAPSDYEDGLLGMSFLGNFILKIDSKSNKLILEEFTPS